MNHKINTLLIICFFNSFLFAQTKFNNREKKQIITARNYLKKQNLLNKTIISDSIVFIPYSNIFDLIIEKDSSVSRLHTLDSLDNLDMKLKFEPFYYKPFCSKKKNLNFNKIVFFSKPFKNTLLIEIVQTINNSKIYNKVTVQTTSIIYFVKFDNLNKITSSKWIEMFYN
jgi:hypothetical protein